MAWSYNSGLTTARDKLRFEIGDVIITRPLLDDEELDYLLTTYGSTGTGFIESAARACEAIAARVMGDPNFQRGSWQQNRDAVIRDYLFKADELRARRGAMKIITPTEGDTDEERKPYFDIGMHDLPGTPTRIVKDFTEE